jgi:hypothetical protein
MTVLWTSPAAVRVMSWSPGEAWDEERRTAEVDARRVME